MTIEDNNEPKDTNEYVRPFSQSGRVFAGLIVVLVGAALLLRNNGVELPPWLFTWPMFLIVLGVFIGAKHSFKKSGWWVVSLIGLFFLFGKLYHLSGHMFWPVFIIIAGLVMIFKPRRSWDQGKWKQKWEDKYTEYTEMRGNPEDYIESTSIFGGIKKNIISKDFKGGEIVCIMGGSEINLMQADINGRVILEVTQVFGGTKLLVPPHWEVIPEMVAILGGIEDKRPPYTEKVEGTKILVISGTTVFGGIDIRSY